MYGIFIYIWLTSMVNVGKYSIHGAYGNYEPFCASTKLTYSLRPRGLRDNSTHTVDEKKPCSTW